MDTAEKARVIEEYATKLGDAGSPDVQTVLLTERIAHLTEHFKVHEGNHRSRRGLTLVVGQRRRLFDYIARQDIGRHRELIARLGLRR